MKEFKAINAGEGAMIHAQLLEMTTLPQHQWLGVVVQDHVLAIVPGERSAMDIINVIKDLKELQEALLKKIADACGKCDRCEEREACELVNANTFSPAIKISPELLRDAGIDPGSKLICLPEDEEGVLHITAADYSKKQICVSAPEATVHELGHFLHCQLGFPSDFEKLFRQESSAARPLLRDYSLTNSHEYFADCFTLWLTYHDNERIMAALREKAPGTYQFFFALEKKNWDC